AFQRKCFDRIEQIKARGATILFVSHGAQTIIQLCDRAILLDRGDVLLDGQAKKVVSQYQRFVNLPVSESEPVREAILQMNGWDEELEPAVDMIDVGQEMPPEVENLSQSWLEPNLMSTSRIEYEQHGVTISDIMITTKDGRPVNNLTTGERYIYKYIVSFANEVKDVGFGMMIKTTQGVDLGGAATDFEEGLKLSIAKAGSRYQVSFHVDWVLNPGTYFLNAGVTGRNENHTGYFHRVLDAMVLKILPTEAATATGIINFNAKPSYHRITNV
ncbi:Wzt carbohydrate-binding domain-containing protein, partial [Hellea sp.]|nr:Wzt carbohydrate-binding domain-containing protein [Hellea sp.]